MKKMLFEPIMLIGGASIIGVAMLDKLAEEYGFPWLGTIVRLILPFAGYVTGIYFIETNLLLKWLL